jgi:LmbE family N-acetylglucosaminyl deacetylase
MHRVLIVAAHPDDDVLGCGGFIAKYSTSKAIRVVFIAEGTTCRYAGHEMGSDGAKKEVHLRTDAARRALSSLGVEDVGFYDRPCGRLDRMPIIEINKVIEGELATFGPDAVFTHSERDVNNDHCIVFRSVQMATRPGCLHDVGWVFSFEVLSSTEWNLLHPFTPNHFEALTAEQVRQKWDALACFESEVRSFPHPRSYEGIETLARYRGLQAGVPYAEAYRNIRTVVV